MLQTQITRLLIVVILVDICAMVGCHRSYYRRQADAEAIRLIQEKANDPRWNRSAGSIAIDPYSRMFNPFSSDHPPIPPDDAASHQLMHNVDGKSGYPHWHANGDTDYVENPDWKSYLPANEAGELVLTLDRAFQLALLHSTELQQQNETLYLSALDVSLERFGFDTQLFTGLNSFVTTRGRLRDGSGNSSTEVSSSLGATGNGLRMSRLGTTGANFAVGIANTILFNFAGNNTQSANSLIDFSVIQPLMRGAGRDRIMESLTQTERTLLANVRQLDRFRRGFYLQIATGRPAGAGPNRVGNFLALPGGATTNVGGYYGLLLQQQQIRNQEFNVRQLESVLELFREFFARDRLDAVQLKLFESTVYDRQSSLVEARVRYQTSVDRFKQGIGLPPDLEVVIQDDLLDQFNLISDEFNDRLINLAKLRKETGDELNKVEDLLPGRADLVEDANFKWSDELGQRILAMRPYLESALKTLEEIKTDDVAQLLADFEKLDSVRDDRLSYLETLTKAIDNGEVDSAIDPSLFAANSISTSDQLRRALDDPKNEFNILNRIKQIGDDIAAAQQQITVLERDQVDLSSAELFATIKKNVQDRIPELLSAMNNTLLELSLLQARARSDSIEIQDVQIDAELATEVARCFRRDWMNARASLVDNWRRIEFVADQLESQVDLVFQGDMGNVGDNPFKLRYETGQLRAGFRFDSPIVRQAERNLYRSVLIQYQQARRLFYQFEDEVKRNLRDIIRNLSRNKVLFELNRRSVQVQIEQIELNRLALEAPIGQSGGGGGAGAGGGAGGGGGGGGGGSTQLGGFTARNLADAINNLNLIQNRFTSAWVEYEVLRRSLDFDMDTMQVDERGVWIDPGLIDNTIGMRAAAAMGIELDCQFCRDDVINPVFINDDSINEQSETIEPPRPAPARSTTQVPDPTNAPTKPRTNLNLNEPQLPTEGTNADPEITTPLEFEKPIPTEQSPEPLPLQLELSPPTRPTDQGSNFLGPKPSGTKSSSRQSLSLRAPRGAVNSTAPQPLFPIEPKVAVSFVKKSSAPVIAPDFTIPAARTPAIGSSAVDQELGISSNWSRQNKSNGGILETMARPTTLEGGIAAKADSISGLPPPSENMLRQVSGYSDSDGIDTTTPIPVLVNELTAPIEEPQPGLPLQNHPLQPLPPQTGWKPNFRAFGEGFNRLSGNPK